MNNRRERNSQQKSQKTKASNSQSQQNRKSYHQSQDSSHDIRPEFLELFDEKIRVCSERNYKRAWIWKVLLDKYLLAVPEICWLCTVFDHDPGWAFHSTRDEYPQITYQEILVLIAENRREWLDYFNSRWQFAQINETRQEYRRQKQNYQQHSSDRDNRASTLENPLRERYQSYLDILRLRCPFSRQELKIAYRKKALETHPDTGGNTEAFRKVNAAFKILSGLAS